MPCYEGPRPEDLKREWEMRDAFPAMLCGMFNGDECARSYANRWCEAHKLVDEERAHPSPGLRIYDLQRACDDILIAFNYARGAVGPCPHRGAPAYMSGRCMDCGEYVTKATR